MMNDDKIVNLIHFLINKFICRTDRHQNAKSFVGEVDSYNTVIMVLNGALIFSCMFLVGLCVYDIYATEKLKTKQTLVLLCNPIWIQHW